MSLLSDNHIYSYSQLSSFDECPFSFYLERIEAKEHPESVTILSNAFSEQGSLIHDILDRWAKGKIAKEDMRSEYERRYSNEVVTQFPRMLAAKGYTQKAYQIGIDYFENFDEFEGYEIISSEEKFKIDLFLSDGTSRPFVGVIDLILKDKQTGQLIICDHKSKSLSSFKKNENIMYRQQHLYCAYFFEKYGCWPDLLMFNLFKEDGLKAQRPFIKEEYNNTIKWATDCIYRIEEFDILEWLQSKQDPDFFCNELCAVRSNCPIGTIKPKSKKEKKG